MVVKATLITLTRSKYLLQEKNAYQPPDGYRETEGNEVQPAVCTVSCDLIDRLEANPTVVLRCSFPRVKINGLFGLVGINAS